MAPGPGGRPRVAPSVLSETFAKRVRFRARMSEQLGLLPPSVIARPGPSPPPERVPVLRPGTSQLRPGALELSRSGTITTSMFHRCRDSSIDVPWVRLDPGLARMVKGLAGAVVTVRQCGDGTVRSRRRRRVRVAAEGRGPAGAPSRERVEGVSRSLPNSDLLALTSSHVFLSVMN